MRETYTVQVNGHTKEFEHEPSDQEIHEFVRRHYPTGKDVIELDGKRIEMDVQPLVTKNFVQKDIRGFIDRFEGDLAVIEVEGCTQDFPRSSLPKGVKPGDAVILDGVEIRLDPNRKMAREKEIKDLMDALWED